MQDLDRRCPECEAERSFYLCASTTLHLGTKRKWRCPDCGYSFVRVDDTVDTAETA